MEAPITPAAEQTAIRAFARTMLMQASVIPLNGIALGNDLKLLSIMGHIQHIVACLSAEEMATHLRHLVDAEITPLAHEALAECCVLEAEATRLQQENPSVARVVREERAFFLRRNDVLRALAGLCQSLHYALRNGNRALAIRRAGEHYAQAYFLATVALTIDHDQRSMA